MPVKTRLQRNRQKINHDPESPPSQQNFISQNIDPRSQSTAPQATDSKRDIIRHRHNAHRTKIFLLYDKKKHAQKPKRKRRVSYFLVSQEYKRKMSQGFQIPQEQFVSRRKISWSQESQYVAFNKNKSCQAVKGAPRHKFSIDQ